MNNYELTVVLPGKATAAKIKTYKDSVEKIITAFKGKVTKIDDWGKRDLAYKISGNTSGNFLIYNVELGSDSAGQLKEKLKMEEGIIRYLMIRI